MDGAYVLSIFMTLWGKQKIMTRNNLKIELGVRWLFF